MPRCSPWATTPDSKLPRPIRTLRLRLSMPQLTPMPQLTQSPPTPLVEPRRPSRISNLLWWTMLVLSAGVAIYGTRYFILIPSDDHFARYILPPGLHIAGGMGTLLADPWQFSRKLRTRAINWHRRVGRFYVLEVALGSVAGFAMALVSEPGLPTHFGFGILAVLWFLTALEAYRLVRRGNIECPSPVDDSKPCTNPRRRHSSPIHPIHALRSALGSALGSALAFPAHLHHGLLALLDSEFTDRRMDGSPAPAPSGTNNIMKLNLASCPCCGPTISMHP
jgi:hypothetical protein